MSATLARLRPASELAADKPHGVRLKYMGGCRCFKCRMANTNYEAARARARARGEWNGYVDAAPAREHILKLRRGKRGMYGVGYKQVARAASVACSVVAKILNGERRRVRAMTVKRILRVTVNDRADHALVSAKRTWKLIGELVDEGFSQAELARRMDYNPPKLQFGKDFVTARTAADVESLYRRLTT